MAVTSMMQRLIDNALTAKFAKSLNHSDLPEGWADNSEIVQLAEDAYSVMGTESPWFKAWFGNSKVVDEAGEPLEVYHGSPQWFESFNSGAQRQHSKAPENTIFTNDNRDVAASFKSYYGKKEDDVIGDPDSPLHERLPWGIYRKGGIYPLYAKAENPLLVDYGGQLWSKPSAFGADINETVKHARDAGFDGVIAQDIIDVGLSDVLPPPSKDVVLFSPSSVKSTSNRGTFNPADPNIYKGIIPAVGAGGLLALMGPEEAEAAPKPAYMMNLVERLKNGKFDEGIDFGEYTKRDLRKKGLEGEGFTPGPVKISPRNLEKFNIKRIGQDNMPFEPFVDGLNSVVHGSRAKAFPNRGDLIMRLAAETDWKDDEPFVQHFWKSVLAPHDGFTGLVTGHKYKPEDAKKDLKKFSGERPSSPFTGTPKEAVTQQGEISAVGETSGLDRATIPASSNSRKAIIPLTVGGVLLPATATGYQFPADKRGTVLYEPGLESPIVDPADLLTAPIGVPTAALKAASVAAEPFISYGMDKAINGLFDLFSDEEE